MTESLSPLGGPGRPRPLELALGLTLLLLCLSELAILYTGSAFAGWAAPCLLLAFALLAQGHFGLRERYLLALAVAATIAAFLLSEDAECLIATALAQAGYLAAFMVLLGLLRDGAATSNSVLALGRYLTRRPPGQRYLAIAAGGHALGFILNFGALSLLGPLIQRGIDAGRAAEPRLAAVRQRRQMSALARGFSWIIVWAPTAVTQALVVRVVVGAEPGRVALYGAGIGALVFLAGWLEDRVVGARARRDLSREGALPERVAAVEPLPTAALGRFALVCFALAVLCLSAVTWAGVAVVTALMLAAPIVTAVWIWQQSGTAERRGAAALARGKGIVFRSMPSGSPEALTLAAAGFIGVLGAGLADAEAVAAAIGFRDMPPLAVYLAAAALVPLLSCLAAPPMLTVTFMGSLYSALPDGHLDPTLLALAFVLGWTLNLTASPFSATSLILGRITGISGVTLSWRWNGIFSLVAYAIAALALALLSLELG